jgi:hypothetical protein
MPQRRVLRNEDGLFRILIFAGENGLALNGGFGSSRNVPRCLHGGAGKNTTTAANSAFAERKPPRLFTLIALSDALSFLSKKKKSRC